MVGVDLAIQVRPRDGAHQLVGQTEVLEDDHLRGMGVARRQLDVGEHVLGVALGDQQRSPLPRRPRNLSTRDGVSSRS